MPMPKKRKPLASKDSALRIWSRKFAFPTSSKLVRSQWSLKWHVAFVLSRHVQTMPRLSQENFLVQDSKPLSIPKKRTLFTTSDRMSICSPFPLMQWPTRIHTSSPKFIAWISSLGYETIIPRINNDVIFFKKLCKFFNDCIGRFARWHQHNGFPWPLPGERWKHLYLLL